MRSIIAAGGSSRSGKPSIPPGWQKGSILEPRHLRYFIAVAEELHFTRAAERLHIEQSPLSRAIRELEADLNVRLFERDSRGTRLTWAGQVLLDDTKRVFASLDQARS